LKRSWAYLLQNFDRRFDLGRWTGLSSDGVPQPSWENSAAGV